MTAQLLINEPPLQVLPTLARHIGLNEAIVLQQIHYWLSPQFNKNLFDGRYWVRNTYERWQKQFPFWSERTIRRTIMNLEERELLVSYMGGHLKQIKFYTIHYDVLNKMASDDPVSSSETDNKFATKDQTSQIPGLAENQGFCPSGQTGHLTWPKWPGGESDHLEQNPEETAENQVSHPAGQNGQAIWST